MSMGKKAIFVASGLLLFVIGRATSQRMTLGRGPHLAIVPNEINLGNIGGGVPLELKFLLRNDGPDRLLITDVKSTCQCTVAELPSRVVWPGSSEILRVTFKRNGLGPKDQRVIVKTNDVRQPISVLTLRANVVTTQPDTPRPRVGT
jgi:hypothetical protein